MPTSGDTGANQAILDWVKSVGGGYVWESEIFAVTLMGVDLDDEQARRLVPLVGVQQIAINAERLSVSAIDALMQVPGLVSLVLQNSPLSADQRAKIVGSRPLVEWLDE